MANPGISGLSVFRNGGYTLLNGAEGNSGFQQMRGMAVSQRMDFHLPAEAELLCDLRHGALPLPERLPSGHSLPED